MNIHILRAKWFIWNFLMDYRWTPNWLCDLFESTIEECNQLDEYDRTHQR